MSSPLRRARHWSRGRHLWQREILRRAAIEAVKLCADRLIDYALKEHPIMQMLREK